MKRTKILLTDKLGWPIEKIEGRPINYFIRCLLHARGYVVWDIERSQSVEKTLAELEGVRVRRDENCDMMYFKRNK